MWLPFCRLLPLLSLSRVAGKAQSAEATALLASQISKSRDKSNLGTPGPQRSAATLQRQKRKYEKAQPHTFIDSCGCAKLSQRSCVARAGMEEKGVPS
jgi:hypothetical protein